MGAMPVPDRLESYRSGATARREGRLLGSRPTDVDADVWEAGWWDEEAYAVQLETGLVGSYEAAKASDKAMPLTIRLSFRGNAEAVRKLAAFFDLYGEGAEFRARGFLPGVARDPSSADPLLAAAVEGATELKGLPP